jgi:hypothetical protein
VAIVAIASDSPLAIAKALAGKSQPKLAFGNGQKQLVKTLCSEAKSTLLHVSFSMQPDAPIFRSDLK